MSFDSDSSLFEKMSGKKLATLFGLAFFGAFMLIQMVQGFPLRSLFIKETVTEEVDVTIKQGNVCVIETADHPREIQNCTYNVGDHLIVTYNKDRAGIESHRLK